MSTGKDRLESYSKVVDVAVLESEEIKSPKQLDAHVFDLDGIDISFNEFLNLFYPIDTNVFQINSAKFNNENISLHNRKINGNQFHLIDSIIRMYGEDLKVELNCIDPSSKVEITNQLSEYNSLGNLGNLCSVRSALTAQQIIETIINRSSIDRSTFDLSGIFGTDSESKYHLFIINVRFYNANPAIKDIIIKLNYVVGFGGSTENNKALTNLLPSIKTKLHVK